MNNLIDKIIIEFQSIFIDSYEGWIYLVTLFLSILLMYLAYLYKKKNILRLIIVFVCPAVLFGTIVYFIAKLLAFITLLFSITFICFICIYGFSGLNELFFNGNFPKPFWKTKKFF